MVYCIQSWLFCYVLTVGLVAVASTPATSFLKDLPSEVGLLRVRIICMLCK